MTQHDQAGLEQRAQAATVAGHWAAAADLWQALLALQPDHPDAALQAARALRHLRRYAQADALMRQAITVQGSQAAFHTILAENAMDRRRWRVALRHWKVVRSLAPRAVRGYARAARALLARGDPFGATRLVGEGLAFAPRDRRLLGLHVDVALHAQDWTTALARSTRGLAVHPGDSGLKDRQAAAQAGADRAAAGTAGGGPAAPVQDILPPGVTASADLLDQYLDSLQKQGGAVRLQQRIDAAQAAAATGLPLPGHAGQMRMLAQAAHDPRLARILQGDTDRASDRGRRRGPGAPIRVVFFFPHVTQTDHLTPLYERMQADPRFDPVILCCRSGGTAQADSFAVHAARYPARDGWQVVDGGAGLNDTISFYDLDADLVLFHTPYSLNAGRPFYLRADFAARHAQVAHVTYGYPLLSLDSASHHVYAGGHVKHCDFVFAESPVCREPYGRYLRASRIHVTGYTKTDEFRRHLEPVTFAELAARGRPLDVIWTPHWQLPGDPKGDTETSNFLRYYNVMLRLAARPDMALHVRPHPLLRLRLNTLGIMKFRAYDRLMDRFRAAGAQVYPPEEGVSYVPALMQAAVLVSDFSSLVAEYAITGRPMIFCRTDDVWTNGKWIGAFGKQMIDACCYTVDDAAELESAIDQIVGRHQHPKADSLARFVAAHDLFPAGSASDRICDIIAGAFGPD